MCYKRYRLNNLSLVSSSVSMPVVNIFTCTYLRRKIINTLMGVGLLAATSAQSYPSFPSYPLVSGAGNPVPPNIMLILDDSGSMEWTFMPNRDLEWNKGNVSWTCYSSDNINYETYFRPAQNEWLMLPYMPGNEAAKACFYKDGNDTKTNGPSRYLGGTTEQLKRFDNWIFRSYFNNSIYYNPAVTYLPWRTHDPLPDNPATPPNRMDNANIANVSDHVSSLDGSLDLRDSPYAYFYVPNVKISSMVRDNQWNYWKYRVSKDGLIQRCDSLSSGQGVAYCDNPNAVWVNETPDLLTRDTKDPIEGSTKHAQRSQSEEVQNFANWFHYHSTRMKMAKAGASEAFGRLDSDIRVGYDAINSGSIIYKIPINSNGGEFKGSNREGFYKILQNQKAEGGTPLLTALKRSGEYYKTEEPYKDRNGLQLSCRRNYAVLVTDGAWSDGSNSGFSYLYEVAHHYWSHDLRPGEDPPKGQGLKNNVPTSGKDYANWQHMNTFGISVGMASKYTTTPGTKYSSNKSLATRKPDIYIYNINSDDGKIDDLAHTAAEGYGDFFMVNDTDQFAEALSKVFSSIGGSKSSSGVAVNSNALTDNTRAFNAGFQSGAWIGELKSSKVMDATTPVWSLSDTFNSTSTVFHNKNFSQRTVLRGKGQGNSGAVLFDNNFTDSALARTSGNDAVTVTDNINYLRGDQSKERQNGGNLRDRTYPIGDIVNSTPAYSNDTKTVYVGANDGMLHAISDKSDGGKVLFSYIPGGVDMATLSTLSAPKYEHRFFVDGSIDVMPKAHHGSRTVLLAAMGRGGRGVFSLDVTDPEKMSSTQVLWDDTAPSSNTSFMPDMGFVLGGVYLRRANGPGRRTVALIPNGIDSPNGCAALIVREINIDGSAKSAETLSTKECGNNGLMALALADVDQNGTVDLVYGGDLKGNVWRWDFRQGIPSSIEPVKLFSGAADRPITGGLSVSALTAENKIFVGFGTGRYISLDDIPTKNNLGKDQRLYGIIDHGDDNPAVTLTDTDLIQRGLHSGSISTGGNGRGRAFDPYEELPTDKEGWYVNLAAPERVIYPPNIAGPTMYITTAIPDTGNIQGDPCDTASGGGYIYAINLFTGTSPKIDNPYFPNRKSGSTPTIKVNGEEVPVGAVSSSSIPTGVQLVVTDGGKIDIVYEQGNGVLDHKDGLTLPDIDPEKKGRLSWREILRF